MKFSAKNIHKNKNNEEIQNLGQNMRCQTLFLESLHLQFYHSAQPCMVAEVRPQLKRISHLAEGQTHDHQYVN